MKNINDTKVLPDRVVCINGIKRLIKDNGYGIYLVYIDTKDADWIDKMNKVQR